MDRPESQNFDALWPIMAADAQKALERAEREPSQMHRREAVRAVFAFIEGATFLVKEQTLATLANGHCSFTDAEIALLRDQQYVLDSKGRAVAQTKFLPIEQNFRFALTMYMRDVPGQLDLNLQEPGWQAFLRSLQVRHRVTHPKRASDFDISDQEFVQAYEAFAWVVRSITVNMAKAILCLRELRDRMLKSVSNKPGNQESHRSPQNLSSSENDSTVGDDTGDGEGRNTAKFDDLNAAKPAL